MLYFAGSVLKENKHKELKRNFFLALIGLMEQPLPWVLQNK